MIVGGEDSSKGLFVTEEEDQFEEPKIGTTLLDESWPILYVAPSSIQDTLMRAQVIASAWEVVWGKKGEIKDPKKAVPGIQSVAGQSKMIVKEAKPVPGGRTRRLQSSALEAVMKAMSSWCPISEVVVKSKQAELVVLEVLPDVEQHSITPAPQMPTISVKAQLKNFNKGEVTFDWLFVARWISPEPRTFHTTFEGITTAQNSEESTWPVSWNQMTRGGDDISVFVVAMADGESYEAKKENLSRIVGENPTIAEVKDGLTIQEQVIAYVESRWRQFVRNNDFPLVGPTGDYGLMQLQNPPPTDEEVWNWRANRNAGRQLLEEKLNAARSYPSRLRREASRGEQPAAYQNASDFTAAQQLWQEAFQRYNYGRYWRWVPLGDPRDPDTPGEWRATPVNDYGNRAWGIYSAVSSGNAPEGWN